MAKKNKIRVINTKKRGEVFTPPALAQKMIDLFPDEGITKDGTILDACVGATFIFPIFYMFRYVEKFGKEYISHFVKKCLYVVEINPIALEWGQMVFKNYIKIIIEKDVVYAKQHYIDNFENIINDYYNYCEGLETEL